MYIYEIERYYILYIRKSDRYLNYVKIDVTDYYQGYYLFIFPCNLARDTIINY